MSWSSLIDYPRFLVEPGTFVGLCEQYAYKCVSRESREQASTWYTRVQIRRLYKQFRLFRLRGLCVRDSPAVNSDIVRDRYGWPLLVYPEERTLFERRQDYVTGCVLLGRSSGDQPHFPLTDFFTF